MQVHPKLSMPSLSFRLQIDEKWMAWQRTCTDFIRTSHITEEGSWGLDPPTAWPGWPAVLSEEAAAERRGLQEGDERQNGDGDEDQSYEDVLVDGEQAHLPHDRTGW